MGFSFLKKQQQSTVAVKMNGQAAADACIAPHNSTATVYLQMVVASSERPRTDCKKCNLRGAATATRGHTPKGQKETLNEIDQKKNPNPLKI